MKKEIILLQDIMKKNSIDAWICPISDPHQSEYIGEYYKSVRFLSGFTGSSATMLVTLEGAYLWTDGRYFIQARNQLSNTGIKLMEQGEKGVPNLFEFISDLIQHKKIKSLGLNGELFSYKSILSIEKLCNDNNINLVYDKELIDEVWIDRPQKIYNKIFKHDIQYCGESASSKINRIRLRMKGKIDACIINSLNDINWIINYRGKDIAFNTSFFSCLYISMDKVIVFLGSTAYDENIRLDLLNEGIEICDYSKLYMYLDAIKDNNVGFDFEETNYIIGSKIKTNNKIQSFIISDLKNIKNNVEIEADKEAHIRDGVYLTRYIKWLKDEFYYNKNKSNKYIDEYTAALVIDNLRKADEKFVDLSFDSISAYGKNAAMPHYSAKKDTAVKLEPMGLYLIDSGAHYLDGTTDVTRTIALGELSDDEKKHYTLTTISMLRLLNIVFKEGTYGCQLDIIARQRLWEEGLDFNHGTGHGVGFCNGVHEGPVSIRKNINEVFEKNIIFKEGMIVSDEPGVYIEGSHGIRMEILIHCVKAEKEGFYKFEPLTLTHIDKDAMDFTLLGEKDKLYYNNYQKLVYNTLKDRLTKEEAQWLYEQTKAV